MADITASIGGGYAHSFNYVWNVDTLEAIRMTQPGSAAGGGDASAANQVTGNASLASLDAKLTNPLPVSLSTVAVTNLGTFAVQAAQSGTWTVTGAGGTFPVTGTFWQATQPISAATLPLPTGAALEAGNLATIAAKDFATQTTLASLDTKTPALGQALAGASTPVVLTAAQVTTLTPPAAIVGFGLESTQLLQATAAKQDTLQASMDTLTLEQGATGESHTGPMVQAVVSESPESFADGTVQPFSLTNQGRLRVSTVPADIDRVWQTTQDSPWPDDNPWQMESSYV